MRGERRKRSYRRGTEVCNVVLEKKKKEDKEKVEERSE